MPDLWRPRPLPRKFYLRPTVEVARDLLGKVLVRRRGEEIVAGRIVETEAYLGGDDKAAHSSAGLTERTSVIFGPPGHAYVYLIYGMHRCLNLVAEPRGEPGCVLLRALEPVAGLPAMRRRRPRARRDIDLASGPGKLTMALGITLDDYGADVTGGDLTVHAAARPQAFQIAVTPRIGIRKSVDLPLRFLIKDVTLLDRGQ